MKKLLALCLCLLLFAAGCGLPGPQMASASLDADSPITEPPDTVPEKGTLSAMLSSGVDSSRFSQVMEVVQDAEGEQVALWSDGEITDLRIDFGLMDPEGISFCPSGPGFTASSLSADQLILLRLYFSDTSPSVRIQYTGAQGEIVRYLFQSGKDGSILMLEQP